VLCWIQKGPARKLINLEGIPVLNVCSQASYHRTYARCLTNWVNLTADKSSLDGHTDKSGFVGCTGMRGVCLFATLREIYRWRGSQHPFLNSFRFAD
jgi:hypothetical protein